MTAPAPASKASGRRWPARFVSLIFLMPACLALPQQGAAQDNTVNIGDVSATEDAGTAGFMVGLGTAVDSDVVLDVAYAADEAAEREVPELGRFSAGPRLTRDFDSGQVTGQVSGAAGFMVGLGTAVDSDVVLDVAYAADEAAEREVPELGRFSAGPRLTRDFDSGQVTGQVTGGARMQWDFLEFDDGVGGQVSGAADIGFKVNLARGVTFGLQGDVDGIGIGDDYRSFGGKVDLGVRF